MWNYYFWPINAFFSFSITHLFSNMINKVDILEIFWKRWPAKITSRDGRLKEEGGGWVKRVTDVHG
jgi:hypothetical protein